jgi:N-acetylmuramoyl-L-alanine amidase CwlA
VNIINKFSTIHTTAKPNREIKYIVIHYTAGVTSKAGSAINTADYYPKSNNVSADYTVDDSCAVCYNGDIPNRYTWHCGGSKYATKGGSLYRKCTNANSIGVEVCSTNSTGKMQTANDSSYSFTEAAVNNAVELVKQLMKWYNIPAENVIRHYDVTGKPCPGIYGWNADSGSEEAWNDFKQRISETPGAPAKKLYRVQVGAFSDRANAEKFLRSVQIHFPQAFIKES